MAVSLMLHVCEAMIYFVIFHHCYKHNKGMVRILGQQVIKRRMRRSAISFACEAYLFLIESVFIIGLYFTANAQTERSYLVFFWNCEFGLRSMIQAMSGSTTRDLFLSSFAQYNVLQGKY